MSKPNILVNTENLTREEWLEFRKHGIGASDLSVLMEANEYRSVLSLYEEKRSRKPIKELNTLVKARLESPEQNEPRSGLWHPDYGEPIIDPNADFSLSKEIGHALEPVIAKYLSCRLGFPVYRDYNIYCHADYPYILVNLDFMMLVPDDNGELNRLVIIECKTASYWKKDDWDEGVPYAYELQCRQAMCVMDVNEVIIICLFDNNEGGIITYKITRNYNIEAEIIMQIKSFWLNHVEKGVLPNPTIPTKAAKRELAIYAKKQKKFAPLPQLFERGLSELSEEYLRLSDEVAEKKAAFDEAAEDLERVKMQFSAHMLSHDEAMCGELKLRWSERKTRKVDYNALKLAYPMIYAKYVQEHISTGFEVKIKESKKEAA